jgi:hypothetical protein
MPFSAAGASTAQAQLSTRTGVLSQHVKEQKHGTQKGGTLCICCWSGCSALRGHKAITAAAAAYAAAQHARWPEGTTAVVQCGAVWVHEGAKQWW